MEFARVFDGSSFGRVFVTSGTGEKFGRQPKLWSCVLQALGVGLVNLNYRSARERELQKGALFSELPLTSVSDAGWVGTDKGSFAHQKRN